MHSTRSGTDSLLEVFCHQSFWRQTLSVKLELRVSDRVSSQKPQGSSVPISTARITAAKHNVLHRAGEPRSSHLCSKHFYWLKHVLSPRVVYFISYNILSQFLNSWGVEDRNRMQCQKHRLFMVEATAKELIYFIEVQLSFSKKLRMHLP